MAARKAPQPPPPPMYRVLEMLERLGGGFHQVGDIVMTDQLHATSIGILMERGVIMPWLDPEQIAALPEYA